MAPINLLRRNSPVCCNNNFNLVSDSYWKRGKYLETKGFYKIKRYCSCCEMSIENYANLSITRTILFVDEGDNICLFPEIVFILSR